MIGNGQYTNLDSTIVQLLEWRTKNLKFVVVVVVVVVVVSWQLQPTNERTNERTFVRSFVRSLASIRSFFRSSLLSNAVREFVLDIDCFVKRTVVTAKSSLFTSFVASFAVRPSPR